LLAYFMAVMVAQACEPIGSPRSRTAVRNIFVDLRTVVPAQAGTYTERKEMVGAGYKFRELAKRVRRHSANRVWIPACAGMTVLGLESLLILAPARILKSKRSRLVARSGGSWAYDVVKIFIPDGSARSRG
jgi:hypothetical protein